MAVRNRYLQANKLDDDDAVLRAVTNLTESGQAYALGVRSDLVGLLGSAASLVR